MELFQVIYPIWTIEIGQSLVIFLISRLPFANGFNSNKAVRVASAICSENLNER